MSRLRLNERSWAIDVISAFNVWAGRRRRAIERAGGEATLPAPLTVRFPDVILFGAPSGSRVLMGWELKLPDTRIDDHVLLRAAETKADLLGCATFLVWNARDAVLHARPPTGGSFHPEASWACPTIRTRRDVESRRPDWEHLLHTLLDALSQRFEERTLAPARPLFHADPGGLVDLLVRHVDDTAASLSQLARRDARFDAESNVCSTGTSSH